MAVLRARLLEMEQQQGARGGARRAPQHGRLGRPRRRRSAPTTSRRTASPTTASTLDLHNLPGVLDGDLDRLIDALITTDQAERLAHYEEDDAAEPAGANSR